MKRIKSSIALLLALIMLLSAFSGGARAAASHFSSDAYATIVTASDFQASGTQASDRFAKILTLMKNDGMQTPCSVLVGGDYTKILFDYASPYIVLIRNRLLSVYPDAKENSVVCIQGNHDNPVAGFAGTGLYDMGAYYLYCLNEDAFPWNQHLRTETGVRNSAEELKKSLDKVITANDGRPVVIMTHVPLHHSSRSGSGDNRYASLIFNVINKAAEQLDIVFIFGHNHSGTFDDYIGGSVNFMAPGETIRIPLADKMGEDCYTEETLNFTYTNCGYVGYSNNSETATSTGKLTVGAIQLEKDKLVFVRYAEDGFLRSDTVQRINSGTYDSKVSFDEPIVSNLSLWKTEEKIIKAVFRFLDMINIITFK